MSFILDALRKSETDRQQHGTSEFAGVPESRSRRQGPPGWLWVVAILLLVNFVVLAGILLRPDAVTSEPPAATATPAAAATTPAVAPGEDFAAQVASARENAPPRDEATAGEQPVAAAVSPPPAAATIRPPADTNLLPTLQEVQAGGSVALPELHVDIHVYSELAADRFVFINMVKHKEGSRLPEGPVVEEITPDGVILRQNGTSFLLPRD